MDSRTAQGRQPDPVAAGLATIRADMPLTYADIQAQAKQRGNVAYALVRRSLKGEPNCFYAIEGGHVVGTPFDQQLTAEVAQCMVAFGSGFVVFWPTPEGGGDAAH